MYISMLLSTMNPYHSQNIEDEPPCMLGSGEHLSALIKAADPGFN